jgi:arylsulfatase A-like enzyme
MAKDLNIILISLDAVRRDHLSCYGYERNTSPNIDALAREGILFEQAIAAAYWTLPSNASILSGLHEINHGAINRHNKIKSGVRLLPQILEANGFVAAGFLSAFLLDELYGFKRDFDIYKTFQKFKRKRPAEVPLAGKITDNIIDWVKKNKSQPFFVFTQFFDAHMPIIPPASFKSLFSQDYKGEIDGYIFFKRRLKWKLFGIKENDLQQMLALYDGAINYIDAQIGRLVTFLKEEGLYHKTLIVITSDHGEQFNEHQKFGHGSFHETEMRVPLIMHCPVLWASGMRRMQLVRHIDLMPTILDLVLGKVSEPADGVSLRPVIEQNIDPQLHAVSDSGQKLNFCIRTQRWKFFETDWNFSFRLRRNTFRSTCIHVLNLFYQLCQKRFRLKKQHLFDLETDPLEKNNLVQERPDIVKELKEKAKIHRAQTSNID